MFRPRIVVDEGPPAGSIAHRRHAFAFWELLDEHGRSLGGFARLEHLIDRLRAHPWRVAYGCRHWMPVAGKFHELDLDWTVWIDAAGAFRHRESGSPRRPSRW